MGFHWPDNFRTVPLLEKIEGRKCHFKGGETQEVDAIILCNGCRTRAPSLTQMPRCRCHAAKLLWPYDEMTPWLHPHLHDSTC